MTPSLLRLLDLAELKGFKVLERSEDTGGMEGHKGLEDHGMPGGHRTTEISRAEDYFVGLEHMGFVPLVGMVNWSWT
jgi:hypothetical protein